MEIMTFRQISIQSPLSGPQGGNCVNFPTLGTLYNKTGEVCIKTRSPPASLPFKGQVTEQTTVNGQVKLLPEVPAQGTDHTIPPPCHYVTSPSYIPVRCHVRMSHSRSSSS